MNSTGDGKEAVPASFPDSYLSAFFLSIFKDFASLDGLLEG